MLVKSLGTRIFSRKKFTNKSSLLIEKSCIQKYLIFTRLQRNEDYFLVWFKYIIWGDN